MAINKNIEHATGITVGHWRIYNVNIDVTGLNITVLWAGYIDEAAYLGGKSPVYTETVETPFSGIAAAANFITELEVEAQPN